MQPLRLASFSTQNKGGNPAGVVIAPQHPSEDEMRKIAADLGYSETVFAHPQGDAWRVRYFSPESEVPFCGHATVALGAALASAQGNGMFKLTLNDTAITVEGHNQNGQMHAALQSPATHSAPAKSGLTDAALSLLGLQKSDLDPRFIPTFAGAGATHLILALKSRDRLAAMSYDLAAGRDLMRAHGIVTIALVWVEDNQRFHVRNAFASGGVIEDPATGAAAAAFAGYLRDIKWPHGGKITIIQGEDMGAKSIITAEIPDEKGASIRVSGEVRQI
ncbi:PhzF family phenazine biosynthesis protein [Sulfitobacter sp. HGT1]|uniref:PhzF family phenazine biosynthesis protein n=1 Tax=Sulfitobacter sp. HGT1 TaxID=2735435 RepID=UPI001593399E|nr:PhzF family phenazine biosynthesis protein [Sulfitobacter sp. HGT1]